MIIAEQQSRSSKRPARIHADTLIRTWLDSEQVFSPNFYEGSAVAGQIKTRLSGARVVLVAPHAVGVTWRGNRKLADRRTGGLVLTVAAATGCDFVVRSGTDVQYDSWTDRTDPFAKAVRAGVAQGSTIIDVHGMSNLHDMDVRIGRGRHPHPGQEPLIGELHSSFKKFDTRVGAPFTARAPHTVVSYVQSVGGTALQVEFAAACRDPEKNPGRASDLVEALVGVVMQETSR